MNGTQDEKGAGCMKWMIASDIHGSAEYAERMLEAYDREQAGRLVLLGDLLYHGPRNPLPERYAPAEVAALLNGRAEEILCVRGNCDSEVDQMMLNFPILADYAMLDSGEVRIFVTHGHVYHAGHLPPLRSGEILLHGHTHVPVWEELEEGRRVLNPGSVSLPRPGTARGYMTLEGREFRWKDLEGKEYHRLAV